MKKLVSMLLIVGIIASLFTCMTVSADDTTVTGNAPAYMLDFSVKGSAEAAVNDKHVEKWNANSSGIYEWNPAYGGTGVGVDSWDYGDKKYAQAMFKFDGVDPSKIYYMKVAYNLWNVAAVDGYADDEVRTMFNMWAWSSNDYRTYSNDVTWTMKNLPQEKVWKTTVLRVKPSNGSNDKKYQQIDICFNGLRAKAVFKYVALFENKSDAENYDPSINKATVNGKSAYVDHFNHTATVTLGNNLDESTIPNFTTADVNFDLYNNVNYDQAAGTDYNYRQALTTVTPLSETATYGSDNGYNYKEIQYKVSGTGMTDVIWTVRTQSKKASYIEPLELIDFTNAKNAGKLVDPDGDSGVNRVSGSTSVGNTTAAYIGHTMTPENYNDELLDDWHYVSYDKSKVDTTKDVYVKIAYRFSDDSVAAKTDKQREFHVWFGGDQQIIGRYGDNVPQLANGWRTTVLKMPAGSAGTIFQIGTYRIHGKQMFKYIAFFDNEEDANNYKFGDINATITTDGTTVNAIYDNAEVASNGARVLALYQGDQLKKVVYSADKDEISVTGLDAGEYTAKAFYWNSLDEGYPHFNGAEATVTIN